MSLPTLFTVDSIGYFFDLIIFGGLSLLCFLLLLYVIIMANVKKVYHHIVPKSDDFEMSYGYTYDYVFVFKVFEEEEIGQLTDYQRKFSLKNFIDRCEKAKLQIKAYYSCQRDEVYCKVRADPARLLQEADRIDYKLLLNPTILRMMGQQGKADTWKGFTITDEFQISSYEAYEYIYAKYCDETELQQLYQTYPANSANPAVTYQFLRPVDRLRLLISIFEANVNDTPAGCGLELSNMVAQEAALAHFPLHNYGVLQKLESKWLQPFSSSYEQPIDIRNYFGEKIGLYFAFLNYFALKLRFPFLLGLLVYGLRHYQGSAESNLLPFYAAAVSIWSTAMIEGWKKQQSTLSMKWGTAGFEDEETERIEFQGETISSPVDGRPMLYFDSKHKFRNVLITYAVLFSFVMIVFAVVVCLTLFQSLLNQPDIASSLIVVGKNYSAYITGLVTIICIDILDRIFWIVAVKLNDYENHRTETNYEDSLVSKLFIFQFFNSYSYVTFLAFFKPFLVESCINKDCFTELSEVLIVLMVVPIFIYCVEDAVIKKIHQQQNYARETDNIEPGRSVGVIEQQYFLPDYDMLEGSIWSYSSIAIQFGYATMFVTAFPLGPALMYLSTVVRVRVDGWKFCQIFRRPDPRMAEDIGVWLTVMDIISVISAIFVYALVFFTSSYLEDSQWSQRWLYFLLVEHFTLFVKYFAATIIDDIPADVTMQLERQEFLVSKVIDNEKDEAEAAVEATVNTAEDKVPVQITDDDWNYPEDSAIKIQLHIEMYQSVDTSEVELVEKNNLDGTIRDTVSVKSGQQHF